MRDIYLYDLNPYPTSEIWLDYIDRMFKIENSFINPYPKTNTTNVNVEEVCVLNYPTLPDIKFHIVREKSNGNYFKYLSFYDNATKSILVFTFKLTEEQYNYLEDGGKIEWRLNVPFGGNIKSARFSSSMYGYKGVFILYDDENNEIVQLLPLFNIITLTKDLWNHEEYTPGAPSASLTTSILRDDGFGLIYFYYYTLAHIEKVDFYFDTSEYIRNVFNQYNWTDINTDLDNFKINKKYFIDFNITTSSSPSGEYWSPSFNYFTESFVNTTLNLQEIYNNIEKFRISITGYNIGQNNISFNILNNPKNNDIAVFINKVMPTEIFDNGYDLNIALATGSTSRYLFNYLNTSVAPRATYSSYCAIISENPEVDYKPYYSSTNEYKRYKLIEDEELYLYIYPITSTMVGGGNFHGINANFFKEYDEETGEGWQLVDSNANDVYFNGIEQERHPIIYEPEEDIPIEYEYNGEYRFEEYTEDIDENLDVAFQNDEREIKAYVKIEYDKPVISYDSQDNYGIELSNLSTGTLYDNKLGFITNEITTDTTISCRLNLDYTLIDGNVNAITLYFVENIPSTITATIGQQEINITNNEKEVVIIDLGSNTSETTIDLEFTNWSIENIVRLENVELGHNEIYKNEELIDMSVLEQVKKFCEETPENECSVTLNNYDGKFDTLNPSGMAQYLTKKSVIKPYIGAVTTDGIEYVNMGIFYLDSWNNNSDYTTTLNCKNIIRNIKALDLKAIIDSPGPLGNGLRQTQGQYLINPSMRLKEYLKDTYNIDSDIETEFDDLVSTESYVIEWNSIKETELLNYLQIFTTAYKNIMYSTRNEILRIKPINRVVKKNLTDNETIDEPKVDKIKKVNKIKLIAKEYLQGEAWYDTDPFINKIEQTIKVTSNPMIVIIKSNTAFPTSSDPNNGFFKLSTSQGTIEEYKDVYNKNQNGVFIKFYKLTGATVGSNVTIKCEYTHSLTETLTIGEINNIQNNEEENILEISNDLLIRITDNVKTEYMQYYLDNATQYNIEFEFIGNAYLKAGDIISVQTKYGDMNIFIESIEHKYDGGLSGHIKGVDINIS